MLPTRSSTRRGRLVAVPLTLLVLALVGSTSAASRGTVPSPSPTPSPTPTPTATPLPTPSPTTTPLLTPSPTTTPAAGPLEDFATYDPQTRCSTRVKPGTATLGAYLVQTWGGRGGATWRPCSRSTSEHQDGRAIDWTLDARDPADVQRAATFLQTVLAPDEVGNPAALARRMGIMYVIWNDQMYPAWDQFAPKPYVSSGCSTRKLSRCSVTLRHRDHLHISLSRAGAKARTSWYVDPARKVAQKVTQK